MKRINFTLDLDVENHGAGTVERNIAVNTMILSLESKNQMPRTDIRLSVANKRRVSNKKSIVPGVTPHIVPNAGEPKKFYTL
jgi:hypothetical protein